MERRDVHPGEAVPTLSGRLESGRLIAVESWFGDPERRSMSPVELFRLDNEIVTVDGHHRLSIAFERKISYPAIIYDDGDTEVTLDRLSLDIKTMAFTLRQIRAIAIANGHKTYYDLLRDSFNIDRMPYLKQLLENFQHPENS